MAMICDPSNRSPPSLLLDRDLWMVMIGFPATAQALRLPLDRDL